MSYRAAWARKQVEIDIANGVDVDLPELVARKLENMELSPEQMERFEKRLEMALQSYDDTNTNNTA